MTRGESHGRNALGREEKLALGAGCPDRGSVPARGAILTLAPVRVLAGGGTGRREHAAPEELDGSRG